MDRSRTHGQDPADGLAKAFPFPSGHLAFPTTPKDWARANQSLFEGYDFSDSENTPNVDIIERQLSVLGFKNVDNNEVVVYYEYNSL